MVQSRTGRFSLYGVTALKIELLDDKTVKIVLTKPDMEAFSLTYDDMDYQNANTKRVILKLIDEVKKQSALDLSSGKLFIEAFPYADGGCILYVNILEAAASPIKRKTSFDTPLIFRFDRLDDLVSLSARLNDRYGHIILKNSLYLQEKQYILFLYTYFKMDRQILHLLNEYGSYLGKGAIAASLVREHSKELIKNDAIQTLQNCLY